MDQKPLINTQIDRNLIQLVALLFFCRMAMVVVYPLIEKAIPEWGWSNNDGYDTIALNWVRTGAFSINPGIPTALRTPLYPLLIAVSYMISPQGFTVIVMAFQALLSIVTGFFLFKTADLLFGRRPALLSLLLFILHPQINNFIFRCATETLFIFLLVMMLYHLVKFQKDKRTIDIVCAAMWLGLSLLTRPTLAPLALLTVPLLFVAEINDTRAMYRRIRQLGMAAGIVLTILTPWFVRNYIQSGYFPVLQTWTGQPIYMGIYCSQHLSEFISREKTLSELDQQASVEIRIEGEKFLKKHPSIDERPIVREVLMDRYFRTITCKKIFDRPLLSIYQFARNLLLAPVIQMTWRSSAVLMVWNWPLLILTLLGLSSCFRNNRKLFIQALPLTIVFFWFLASHALIWPQARYVLPAFVPFSSFAALYMVEIYDKLRSHYTSN